MKKNKVRELRKEFVKFLDAFENWARTGTADFSKIGLKIIQLLNELEKE